MLQQTIAGPARPADEADALKRKLAVQSGDLTKIKTAYATAQTDAQKANDRADKAEADLKTAQAKAATEQANAAAVLQKQIDKIQTDADARVKQVQDAERKAWLSKLNYVLLGMGALLILAGVATAWLTGGADLAKSLILAAGGALCFGLDYTLNQPWFQYVAIGSVVLTVIGTGVWAYIEWRDHKADKVAAVVDTSAQKVVATLDTAYESATPEIKAVLDPIFSKLGNNMDAAEKDAIKLLRYKATVTAPAAPSPEIPTQPKT